MRIAVTGATGKLGSVVEAELIAAGHEVRALDAAGPRRGGFTRLDLTDYGQVADVLGGRDGTSDLDAVVHLGAIPAPGLESDVMTFRNNMLSTSNVLQAARRAGIRRIAFASSETVLGLPFDVPPPYLPVDEEYPTRPESVYALEKHLEEELATKLVRWDPELSISGFRFSNVMVPADYPGFAAFQADPAQRRFNLFGYIDARDGAQAILRALETARPGFEAYVIAAADTVTTRPTAELIAEWYPDTPVTRELGEHESLLSTAKAARLLGYSPQHSWRAV